MLRVVIGLVVVGQTAVVMEVRQGAACDYAVLVMVVVLVLGIAVAWPRWWR